MNTVINVGEPKTFSFRRNIRRRRESHKVVEVTVTTQVKTLSEEKVVETRCLLSTVT